MSPLNYNRTPPGLGWKDAGGQRVSAPQLVKLSPETLAFIDHLAALTNVVVAARRVYAPGGSAAIKELGDALDALDGFLPLDQAGA